MTAQDSSVSPARGKRVSVRMRVLGFMGVAMTLFLLALLFIVYEQVASAQTAAFARSTVVSLIPLVLFILAVCGGLFFWMTNRLVLGPIKKIRDGAQAVSEGKFDTAISSSQNDEIGDLARSVQHMANALRHDIQSLKEVDALKSEFITISSHSLRTPLASIEGGLDMLQSAALDDQSKKMLGIVRASASNLVRFSEDMLTIAGIEAQQGAHTELTQTALGELLAPVIVDAEKKATKRRLHFTVHLDAAKVRVGANPPLLRLAIRNLLDNACKFTEAGGTVTLSVREQKENVVVEVTDSGIGIARSELPNLFTKFHRGTDTLAYNYEGTGVGLYITKLILDQHRARIDVNSTPGKGTTVVVSLPKAS